MSIRVLVVEDELPNSKMICGMINQLRPEWEVLEVLDSVQSTVEWLESNQHPNMMILDIQLSDGVCFDIFNEIEIENHCKIIFTTAYNEYAVRAFKLNSIDYLLKPISDIELEHAFQKFEKIHHIENRVEQLNNYYRNADFEEVMNSIVQGRKEYRSRFLISGVSQYHKLETCDIAYIYAEQKIITAVDFKNRAYLLSYNLEQVESELDPKMFFRANRKVIVNIDAVDKIFNDVGSKLKITTQPATDFEIGISRLRSSEFKLWMGK